MRRLRALPLPMLLVPLGRAGVRGEGVIIVVMVVAAVVVCVACAFAPPVGTQPGAGMQRLPLLCGGADDVNGMWVESVDLCLVPKDNHSRRAYPSSISGGSYMFRTYDRASSIATGSCRRRSSSSSAAARAAARRASRAWVRYVMKRESALLAAAPVPPEAAALVLLVGAPELPLPTPGRLLSVAPRKPLAVVWAPGARDSAVYACV